MFSYLWYGAYENLVVSLVGLKRFNLLGSSSSIRASMSSLECVISFSRYLVLKLVISVLTVGICRSVCKIVFGTYHGACLQKITFKITALTVLFLFRQTRRLAKNYEPNDSYVQKTRIYFAFSSL
jgi:hypothetical protein